VAGSVGSLPAWNTGTDRLMKYPSRAIATKSPDPYHVANVAVAGSPVEARHLLGMTLDRKLNGSDLHVDL
jgi:hypothetical protein